MSSFYTKTPEISHRRNYRLYSILCKCREIISKQFHVLCFQFKWKPEMYLHGEVWQQFHYIPPKPFTVYFMLDHTYFVDKQSIKMCLQINNPIVENRVNNSKNARCISKWSYPPNMV
jgi:hypothetical protein